MPEKKSVLIIDDHALFREVLKAIIQRDSRYQMVGEAGEADEGLRVALKLRPDLALADISLPDRSGINLTAEIHKRLPKA